MPQDSQIAVFIDFDNIEMSVSEVLGKGTEVDWTRVLQTAAQMGRVILRRAYADWAEAADQQRTLLAQGVDLIHVNSRRGKNAADIRIVIDALELLYAEQNTFTHVLLVSGDGDFTELVHRLRTRGKVVVGLGVSGRSAEFLINACDKFIFYDRLPGITKTKKPVQNNHPNGSKPSQPREAQAPAPPAPASPESMLDQYVKALGSHKIRITPTEHRPAIIYKLHDMLVANPGLSFNQLKEATQAYFANQSPAVEPQSVHDTAHQLFHTFCFEFDADDHERIMDRKMKFVTGIQRAMDLLERCDRKIIHVLVSDYGAPENLDKEALAHLLYGGVPSPRVFEHITRLLQPEPAPAA
jgi:uncharacterized LabA/DUF88 family protein